MTQPDERSITDPRVVSSYGGGMFPEQHWGTLTNGVPFYFRMRHNSATLKIGPVGASPDHVPFYNPEYVPPTLTEKDKEELRAKGLTDEQIEYGESYVRIEAAFDPDSGYFWGPVGVVTPYEEEGDQGSFYDDETRQRAFTECLNQIEAVGYGDAFTVDASIFYEVVKVDGKVVNIEGVEP